jgi:hypothetical protein
MKRSLALALLMSLVATIAGCGAPAASGPAASSTATATTAVASGPYAPIAVDGAHEKAAEAALPAALVIAAASAKAQKQAPADVTTATATLVSYVVQAQVGDQIVLFEVHADGHTYELYNYPAPPDPKSLSWQPASVSEGAFLTDAASDGERGAVSAVERLVATAKPGKTATIKIYGYTFFWLRADGTPVTTADGTPFSITIDPKGDASSWSM